MAMVSRTCPLCGSADRSQVFAEEAYDPRQLGQFAFASRKLPEYRYPKGVLLRRVNNSGDISWHKTRIFISEVFRFEELAFELVTPDFYRVFFSRHGDRRTERGRASF